MQEAERELSELASSDALDAKIDRPARTVAFGKPKTDLLVLEEWSSSLSKYVSGAWIDTSTLQFVRRRCPMPSVI